jgi:hypothetical protein
MILEVILALTLGIFNSNIKLEVNYMSGTLRWNHNTNLLC